MLLRGTRIEAMGREGCEATDYHGIMRVSNRKLGGWQVYNLWAVGGLRGKVIWEHGHGTALGIGGETARKACTFICFWSGYDQVLGAGAVGTAPRVWFDCLLGRHDCIKPGWISLQQRHRTAIPGKKALLLAHLRLMIP